MELKRGMVTVDVQADRVQVTFGGAGISEAEFEALAGAVGNVCCAISGRPAANQDRQVSKSVRIVAPAEVGSAWRVELGHRCDGATPYDEAYLATSRAGALRVAALLLDGEPVPANYRIWS